MGSCGANKREFKDQSAIKENLGQKNAFLVAKHGLMEIKDQFWCLIWAFLGEQNMNERKEERKEEKKKKKKKKKKKMKGMETMFLYGNVCMEISGSISRV